MSSDPQGSCPGLQGIDGAEPGHHARAPTLSAWFSPWRAWRERRLATRCCQQLVALHDRIAPQKPWLRGRALYLQVVAEALDGDFEKAGHILRAAEESYTIWPTDRPLNFADVAHYMAVARCQQAADDGALITTEIRPLVDALVGRQR